MKFYFVYSSGGGAGDWNAIDRIFTSNMPSHFKNNLLIKFGDVFFNHRSITNLIKPVIWAKIDNVRNWLVQKTGDTSLLNTPDLLLDVGTSKIVSYITSHNVNATGKDIINEFDVLMSKYSILDKFCDVIIKSNIENAVTFDIPNLFKVRTQSGNTSRNLFNEPGCRDMIIDACANYANYTYANTGSNSDRLMVIISAQWSNVDITRYLSLLKFQPTKLAIGGLTDFNNSLFSTMLLRLNALLNFSSFKRVHFLGSGGLKKTTMIINSLGNHSNFSVDNTTPFNRAIDGNIMGTSQSSYYDYISKSLTKITPSNKPLIIAMHKAVPANVKHFTDLEMDVIIDEILKHQSSGNHPGTYDNRAKLIIHNFDVYRHHAS